MKAYVPVVIMEVGICIASGVVLHWEGSYQSGSADLYLQSVNTGTGPVITTIFVMHTLN